jgi:hypothetical protein
VCLVDKIKVGDRVRIVDGSRNNGMYGEVCDVTRMGAKRNELIGVPSDTIVKLQDEARLRNKRKSNAKVNSKLVE